MTRSGPTPTSRLDQPDVPGEAAEARSAYPAHDEPPSRMCLFPSFMELPTARTANTLGRDVEGAG